MCVQRKRRKIQPASSDFIDLDKTSSTRAQDLQHESGKILGLEFFASLQNQQTKKKGIFSSTSNFLVLRELYPS